MFTIKHETPAETIRRAKKHKQQVVAFRVEWSPRSPEIPRAEAREFFEKNGFSGLLGRVWNPEAETILKSAASRGKGKGLVAREFARANSDTRLSIGIYRSESTGNGDRTSGGETGDRFHCLARVRIGYKFDPSDPAGRAKAVFAAFPPEGETSFSDEEAMCRALAIARQANHDLAYLTNADLSAALRAAVTVCNGVQTLGRGNAYLVRPEKIDELFRVMEACYTAGWITLSVDGIFDGDLSPSHAPAEVEQAHVVSLEEELGKLRAELKEACVVQTAATESGEKLHGRVAFGWRNKLESLELMSSKLELYESVIREKYLTRINETRGELAAAFESLLGGTIPDLAPSKPGESAIDGTEDTTGYDFC